MKIIIIGAGISGLAAAYTLQKYGRDTLVLEEKNTPGGRTKGNRKNGFVVDHGAQFFMKCYNTTLSLIHELGIEDEIVPEKHKPLLWVDGNLVSSRSHSLDLRSILKKSAPPAGAPMALLKGQLQAAKLLFRILKKRKHLDFVQYENALDLDREYFSGYVLRRAGKEALEYIFQPMISGITLGNAEEIGALYGVALFWNLMRGNWVLKNGIHSLAQRLYERVRPLVRLSTPVEKIILENNHVRGVETRDGFIDADAVICATTATAARNMLPDLPGFLRFILEKVQYRACCHAVFAYDRPVIPGGCNVVGFPRKAGATMSAFADSAGTCSDYAPPGASLIHCYTYDRFADAFNRMPDEKIIPLLQSELKKYLPSIPDIPLFSEIYRWKEAMCFAPPGMYAAVNKLKKENGREIEGIYFAGDYLNLASVEGSARSGMDAAEAVIKNHSNP
jgi:protoporphyrinogen/coproporphyrinogen III oxidase